MRHVTVNCELIGQQDGQRYTAKINVMLQPINVNEEAAPIGETVLRTDLAAGQKIPDGNYTRLPFQYGSTEKRVRVVSGRMFIGWF